MPRAVPHPCNWRGCSAITTERYCERHRLAAQKRTASDRGNTADRGYGWSWQKVRDFHIKREPLCRECLELGITNAGTPDAPNHVDHIVAKRDGGTDADSNLQTLCRDHHREKTRRETDWG